MTATLDTLDAEQALGHPVVIEAPKAVTGRPSSFTPEKAQRIIEQLSDGIPLREICRQANMPAWQTVYDWMIQSESLSVAIARARELGQDAIAEDTLQIVDSEPERGPDGKIDPAWVALQKIKVEQRLKLLAKWNPKRYGDRVDIGNADDKPFQVLIAK